MCVGILKILSNVRDFIVVTKTIVFEFLLFINKTSCKHIAEGGLSATDSAKLRVAVYIEKTKTKN